MRLLSSIMTPLAGPACGAPGRSCCDRLSRVRLAKQEAAAVRTEVEQQVDRGEPGDERHRGAVLRVLRMAELLPAHRDAGLLERGGIEIAARAAEAAEEAARARRLAQR